MQGPPGKGPARTPANAREARAILRETDLDREAERIMVLAKKLRRRLERSLETLCPLPADGTADAIVCKPPPLALTQGVEALAKLFKALSAHQRDGQKIELAAIRAFGSVDETDVMTPEDEEEELEAMVRERLEAMTPDQVRALLTAPEVAY